MERTMMPKIGLLVCGSNASNTGALTAAAALKIITRCKDIAILSLPSLANQIPRQIALAKKIEKLIVVDGCHNECAKKILEGLGIKYDAYLNLEYDLKIMKSGPFTTLDYSEDDLTKVEDAIYKLCN